MLVLALGVSANPLIFLGCKPGQKCGPPAPGELRVLDHPVGPAGGATAGIVVGGVAAA